MYDESDRLTEVRQEGTNADGQSWRFAILYRYDEHGRVAEERHIGADGTTVRTRCPRYTGDGIRIEAESFPRRARNACGSASHCVVVNERWMAFDCRAARAERAVYTSSGSPDTITFFGRFGRTVGKVLFESDSRGCVRGCECYGELGAWHASLDGPAWLRPLTPLLVWGTRKWLNVWTSWNLLRAREWRKLTYSLRWGALWNETEWRYDPQGRRTEERETFAAKLQTRETWEYDAAGRLLGHDDYDETGAVTLRRRYSYRDNNRGHWIARQFEHTRPDGRRELADTATRVIEYA
jgi:YD repeat-containing protein